MRNAFHLTFTFGGGVLIALAWLMVFPLFLVASLAFLPRPFASHGSILSRL